MKKSMYMKQTVYIYFCLAFALAGTYLRREIPYVGHVSQGKFKFETIRVQN